MRDERDTRCMPPTPYADVLRRNFRAARAAADLSQADVGERMRSLGHASWLRQTMSTVEKGKRRITAEEVFALAYALDTSIARLIRPTEEDGWISFPSGMAVHITSVVGLARGVNDTAIRWNGNKPESMGTSFSPQFRELFGLAPDVLAAEFAKVTEAEHHESHDDHGA
jgi:transcriptional regulator with XRE-family HTH domain